MSPLITPKKLLTQLPLSKQSKHTVIQARQDVISILNHHDDRLLVIVGPCSIHDSLSALEYANRLKKQIQQHEKNLCIVMRAYIEKARTSVGWKGLINDPHLDGSCSLNSGLHKARSLLLSINEIGVPTASELLNPFLSPYFSDIFAWAAIGARTTESQLHREFASGFSFPIGFKNNTSGNIPVAIDAVKTANQMHHFLGLNLSGKATIIETQGNVNCHVILRGSYQDTNYDDTTIQHTVVTLQQNKVIHRVMVDCSHGNCQKNYAAQLSVVSHLAKKMAAGDQSVFGVMLESHLIAGKQTWSPNQPLRYGQSITDACLGWEDTEIALDELSHAIHLQRQNVIN